MAFGPNRESRKEDLQKLIYQFKEQQIQTAPSHEDFSNEVNENQSTNWTPTDAGVFKINTNMNLFPYQSKCWVRNCYQKSQRSGHGDENKVPGKCSNGG